MKKNLFFLTACLCMCVQLFAQIKATVLDSKTKQPVAKASILSTNNKAITVANESGVFEVGTDIQEVIVSAIGYQNKTVSLRGNNNLVILLEPLPTALEKVEITATSNLNKSLLSQPASITKISLPEIKRGTGLFLDDAINANVPGVTMQRRAVSSGQQFNIRGYGNGIRGTNGMNSNFDGQGYKVYINGIPVTDAEGITIMDDIDFASIGNVEITKGPSGTLYGMAIAGVVNLRTIKPEKGKTTIAQEILTGNYGLQRYTTTFTTAKEKSSLLINYGYQKSDGFMVHNASRKHFANVFGEFTPNEKQTITTYFAYTNSYDERAGELDTTQYKTLDYSGNPNYIKRNAHSEVIGFRAGVGHKYVFNNSVANNTVVYGSGYSNNASSAGGWTDKMPFNYGLRSTFDLNFNINSAISLSSITGIEIQRQRAQTIGYNMAANPYDPSGYYIIDTTRSNQFTITGSTAVFTDWTLQLPNDFSVTAGLGYSLMEIELNDKFKARGALVPPLKYDTTYKGMLAPKLAINKVFSKKVSVYLSYSRGYKAPVSSYFFIPTSANNTGKLNSSLKPEVADQFEIGSKGLLLNNKLAYDIALFELIFSDKMTAVPYTVNGTTLYSYITNGGKQKHKGVEASLKYTAYEATAGFFRNLRPWMNITYSDFKYDNFLFQKAGEATPKDYSGFDVAGVAKWVTNIGLDYELLYGIYGNVHYMYKDAVPITSDNKVVATSYNLLNAKIGIRQQLLSRIDMDAYFGINNITNTQYPMMVFVNQLPDAYVPAPLKAVYFGGLNIRYHF